jgi:hypothetical protein
MALGIRHWAEAIVLFLPGGIPQVEAVLLTLILAELVVILEDRRLVVLGVGIALEHKKHAGLANSTIADGNNSKSDGLLRHVAIVVVCFKN